MRNRDQEELKFIITYQKSQNVALEFTDKEIEAFYDQKKEEGRITILVNKMNQEGVAPTQQKQ